MKKSRAIAIFVAVVAVVGAGYWGISRYLDAQPSLDFAYATEAAAASADGTTFSPASFAVMSDLHFYDPALGSTGAAFEEVMGSDRKLLLESGELLNLAIDRILASDAEFVLIPGDLTKDGEVVNHQGASAHLRRLVDAGIPVYVVPGNHDANNPDAERFEGSEATPIESVSQDEFAQVYADFGYGDALSRDANSLSYVAELNDATWLLAIDSTRSEENVAGEHEITAGALTQGQLDWMTSVLTEAQAQGKTVIAMMHHGVVEHWDGQSELHGEYLVDDYPFVGELLASYGVRVVFTGHYHAQDVAVADYGESGRLYDIETGSLVTAPCPVRFCDLTADGLDIRTEKIVADLRPGTSYAEDALQFVWDTIKSEAYKVSRGYHVSEGDSDYIADRVSYAFAAHYGGDENPTDRLEVDTSELDLWGKFIWSQQEYVVDGLWSDSETADNDVSLRF